MYPVSAFQIHIFVVNSNKIGIFAFFRFSYVFVGLISDAEQAKQAFLNVSMSSNAISLIK